MAKKDALKSKKAKNPSKALLKKKVTKKTAIKKATAKKAAVKPVQKRPAKGKARETVAVSPKKVTKPAPTLEAKAVTPAESSSPGEMKEVSQDVAAAVVLDSLESDLSGFDDEPAAEFSADLDDDISGDISVDFDDEAGFGPLAEGRDDDLTEDLSEELEAEKYFREAEAVLDDDDLPRGW